MYNACVNTKVNIMYPLKYKLLFFLFIFLSGHNLNIIHKNTVIEDIGRNIRSVNRLIKELIVDNIIEYNKGYIRIIYFDNLIYIINTYLQIKITLM